MGSEHFEWEENVSAFAGTHSPLDRWSGHLANRIGEGAGRIDDNLGADTEGALCELVFDYHAGDLAVGLTLQVRNPRVIQGVAASVRETLHQSEVVARVIKLAVRISDGADQAFLLQVGHAFEGLLARQKFTGRDASRTGEPVVHLQANVEISGVEPAIAGH